MIAVMTSENEDIRQKVTAIYNKYGRLMFYIAKNILRDTYLAEDAVSEAFVKIIDNHQKIDNIDCYRTKGFVVVIVRNISLNMLKYRERHEEVNLEEISDFVGGQDIGFDTIAAKEACKKIVSALGKINKNYCDLLYLKIEMDCSMEEMSKILNISRENVKMRLSRARKALKQQLVKEYDFL